MNCHELQQRLDEYLNGELDTIQVSTFEQHMMTCESCDDSVKQGKIVQAGLERVATDIKLPDAKFISSAFQKVREQYPEQQKTHHRFTIGVRTGFVSALAAGFLLWAVLTPLIFPELDSSTDPDTLAYNSKSAKISTLSLKINETRVIRLVIDTPNNFDKVTLSVLLPKHVEIKGHKNTRKLNWDTRLVKGNNILKIPLIAIESGQGELIAHLMHNGKVKTFKVFLKSKKPGLSHNQVIELQV